MWDQAWNCWDMQPREIVVVVIRSAKPEVDSRGWWDDKDDEEGSKKPPPSGMPTLVATSSSAATGAKGAKTLWRLLANSRWVIVQGFCCFFCVFFFVKKRVYLGRE